MSGQAGVAASVDASVTQARLIGGRGFGGRTHSTCCR